MFVLTSPLPLEGGEQDLPHPPSRFFPFYVGILSCPPFMQSCSYALSCVGPNNARRNVSTIAFGGEQDLPTHFWSCCLHVCVVVLCWPLLQFPLSCGGWVQAKVDHFLHHIISFCRMPCINMPLNHHYANFFSELRFSTWIRRHLHKKI